MRGNGRAAGVALLDDRRTATVRRAMALLAAAALVAGLGTFAPPAPSRVLAAEIGPLGETATITSQASSSGVDLTSGVPAITYGDLVDHVATVSGTADDGVGGYIDPTSGSVNFYYCYDASTAPVECSSGTPWTFIANDPMNGGGSTGDGIATATLTGWMAPAPGWYLLSAAYDSSGGTYDPVETTGDTVGGLVEVEPYPSTITTQASRSGVDLTSGVPAITTGDSIDDVATVTGTAPDGAGAYVDPTSGSVDFYYCHDPRTAPTECSSGTGWAFAGNDTMDGGSSSGDGIATATLDDWTPPNGGGWYLISAVYDSSGGTYDGSETTGDVVHELVHVLYDTTTVTIVDPTTGGYGATYTERIEVIGSATDGSGGLIDPTGTVRVYYCYDLDTAPTGCSAAAGYPITTLSLTDGTSGTDGIGEVALVDWLPPLAGYYKLHAVYRGDDVYAPSIDGGANEDIFAAYTTVTYTGQTYAISDGTTTRVELRALVQAPGGCVSAGTTVEFTVEGMDGGTATFVADIGGDPLAATTTGDFAAGIYMVTATSTSASCSDGTDVAILTIGSPGQASNGGGWYKPVRTGGVDWSGNPRVNFGYNVTKTTKTVKSTGVTTTTYRGQLLWLNKGQFRIRGTVFSQTDGTGGDYGIFTCPTVFLASLPSGVTGTKCGSLKGTGILQQWSDELGWVSPGIFPSTVTFTALAYDAGQLKSCKGKGKLATCSLTEVPGDWFGIQVNELPNTAIRESAPTKLGGGSLRVL